MEAERARFRSARGRVSRRREREEKGKSTFRHQLGEETAGVVTICGGGSGGSSAGSGVVRFGGPAATGLCRANVSRKKREKVWGGDVQRC